MNKLTTISCVYQEIHLEECLTATLYENGIIEVLWDKNLDIVDVYHLMELQDLLETLFEGKKMPILFIPHDKLQTSIEAAKYAVSQEGVRFTQAIAMIINDPILQFNYNYFLKNNTPLMPTQAFTKKEEAFAWLLQFSKD